MNNRIVLILLVGVAVLGVVSLVSLLSGVSTNESVCPVGYEIWNGINCNA